MLGLPASVRACLFDLNGVLTDADALNTDGDDVVVTDLAELLEKT